MLPEVLQDPQIEELNPEKVERVIFCSGKVYYDLIQYRKENELNQTAIIRGSSYTRSMAKWWTAA